MLGARIGYKASSTPLVNRLEVAKVPRLGVGRSQCSRVPGCQEKGRHPSSVVEHSLGKGEVVGSNPMGGF